MALQITLRFQIETGDYREVACQADALELAKRMVAGEADFPDVVDVEVVPIQKGRMPQRNPSDVPFFVR